MRPSDRYTVAKCKAMLARSLEGYTLKLEACVTRPMADQTYAAFLSLSYNIGLGGFCKSSVARLWNAGESRAAYNAMLRFNRAAGVTMPGLTQRRTQERALCLKIIWCRPSRSWPFRPAPSSGGASSSRLSARSSSPGRSPRLARAGTSTRWP